MTGLGHKARSAVIWNTGFNLFRDLLQSIETPFDPNEHEAVIHEDGDGEPMVTATMRTGYRLKDRVIRPAMVKVAK